ncbi:MAG: M56 family metallopeptidase [Acidobacteria bacterium]|nr:M56 family metallopeptidase [Acidobacteriota bacterium]MBV9475157.1 M56 family metallopeptidase [Acidobacteriota bacterium]
MNASVPTHALALSWLAHVAQALWQGTAAALVLLACERLLRRRSPRLRHALLLIALIKFVLPPMLPLPTGVFSAAPPAPRIHAVRQLGALPSWIVLAIAVAYGVGATVAFARVAAGAWHLHGLRRRSFAAPRWAEELLAGVAREHGVRPPRLLASDEAGVPMTFGVFAPAVVLPRALPSLLDRDALRDVFAHELLHVRRGDLLLNLAGSLIAAAWWFHPLVQLIARRARALREECCDDELLASGLHDAAVYARTLAATASLLRERPPFAAAAVAEEPHALLARVLRIANGAHPTRRLGLAAIAIVITAALLLLPGLRVSSDNHFAFDRATLRALGLHHH